jgi:hypothetical protein
MVIEFTAVERPNRLASKSYTEGMVLEGGLTFEAVPGGTRMSWAWTLHPTGVTRLLGPLVKVIGGRNERRIWTRLKHHLESRSPSRPTS